MKNKSELVLPIQTNRLDRGFNNYQTEFEQKSFGSSAQLDGMYLAKEVCSFEKEFASFINTRYCVGVGSGLDALWLAVRALHIGKR